MYNCFWYICSILTLNRGQYPYKWLWDHAGDNFVFHHCYKITTFPSLIFYIILYNFTYFSCISFSICFLFSLSFNFSIFFSFFFPLNCMYISLVLFNFFYIYDLFINLKIHSIIFFDFFFRDLLIRLQVYIKNLKKLIKKKLFKL
jgi:hypothetical protein